MTLSHSPKSGNSRVQRLRFVLLVLILSASSVSWLYLEFSVNRKSSIGLTADVTDISSGLVFKALVDTGAARCSINCLDMEIEGESDVPEQNLGKPARILVANEKGEQRWLEVVLSEYRSIRNVDISKPRYQVRLDLSCQGVTREVTVTLRDRSHMTYRMLLGRNFLRDEFVVDVSHENPTVR